MPDFEEVADRVWVARHVWFDLNITLIGGQRGLVVVDTHGSVAGGRGVVDDIRRLGAGDVIGVVNTHWHFDHTFGNAAFREQYGAGLPITAHEDAVTELSERADEVKRRYADDADDPMREDVIGSEIVLPDQTFSSARVLDLGDRAVELVHPGRGHTAGDLVVVIPDAGALLAGDLVEESGMPHFNDDCWPMEWPSTLDLVLNLVAPDTVVVPGHGAPVDRGFVEQQRDQIGTVAETIRDLASRGVPVGEAPGSAEWPWPPERLAHAVRRGYDHLPRSQKRLPLI